MQQTKSGRGVLAAGGIAAVLPSTCCLGPLVLVTLGFTGAWIGNLTALEPFRPLFIGVALIALFFAWRGIFRRREVCESGEIVVCPRSGQLTKSSSGW